MSFPRLTPKHLALIILLFVISVSLPLIIYLLTSPKASVSDRLSSLYSHTKPGGQELENQPASAPPSFNLLFIGYGGEGHPGGTLADTIIVLNINHQKKLATLISIPRDTWVKIPVRSDETTHEKINMAHAIGTDDTNYPLKEPSYQGFHGGGNLTKHVLKSITGLDINYYISLDFEGFKNSIDILGGIVVNVPRTFTDRFYPVKGKEDESCGKSPEEIASLSSTLSGFELEKQFECRYEHLHFDQGPVSMNGETALKFVRSRHSDEHGGDFARSERQFAILHALKDKLLKLESVDNALPFFQKFAGSITTDINEIALSQLIALIGNPEEYKISSLHITDQNLLTNSQSSTGQYILIPRAGIDNWQETHQFITESLP